MKVCTKHNIKKYMQKTLKSAVLLSGFILASGSYAEEKRCIVESFSEFGDTKTCIENINLPATAFKQVCEPGSDEYVKIKSQYVAVCPPKFKGVCRGLKTQSGMALPYVSYIYKNDIDFMKKSCEANGGTWESGDQ